MPAAGWSAASRRAAQLQTYSYQSLESILQILLSRKTEVIVSLNLPGDM
jgi:hypothetical protein